MFTRGTRGAIVRKAHQTPKLPREEKRRSKSRHGFRPHDRSSTSSSARILSEPQEGSTASFWACGRRCNRPKSSEAMARQRRGLGALLSLLMLAGFVRDGATGSACETLHICCSPGGHPPRPPPAPEEKGDGVSVRVGVGRGVGPTPMCPPPLRPPGLAIYLTGTGFPWCALAAPLCCLEGVAEGPRHFFQLAQRAPHKPAPCPPALCPAPCAHKPPNP
jgi:hypothetical protein